MRGATLALVATLAVAAEARAEPQIQVETASDPDGGVAVHAVLEVAATPDAVWGVIATCEADAELFPDIETSHTESRSDGAQLCVSRADAPFPFPDPQTALYVEDEAPRADGTRRRRWSQVEGRGSYLRNEGTWTLTALGGEPERTRLVLDTVVDVGGFLPDWIVAPFQRRNTRIALERIAERAAEATPDPGEQAPRD